MRLIGLNGNWDAYIFDLFQDLELAECPNNDRAIKRTGRTSALHLWIDNSHTCDRAFVHFLGRLQLFGLFSDRPESNFTVGASRDNVISSSRGSEAKYATEILGALFVSVVDDPEKLTTLW